ncbi:putative sodium-coupled neutral amino acid transporter 10 [Mytilus trossulus]|uniref:putative sodium-coupled neutral amino acid transporter 10 n=1 Tax=Mytilus trossulus TaxID=6551 RepID=UPI0030051480
MSEDSHIPHILNLSNSIIGVTVLAMPFCYKECGIVLGTILLFFCSWLTLSSCQMLMKAGLSSKKRSYGYLAYYTHGSPGKVAVEIGMIGLQMGTLVAQVVIIGDLGPAIISKFTGIENSSSLRTGLIILTCLGVGLPLGLLRNLNSISKASTLCIIFYAVFVVYIVTLSLPNLLAANWYSKVYLWKTDGLFKCLPIFSFAFGCQTQLFILYDSLVDPSLTGMNSIVGSAVNMCTCAYLLVGFFGYVCFCDTDITGDIINHLPLTIVSDLLKLGFVISIAITFPLIIFPCRASLYTLLFPQRQKIGEELEQRPVLPEIHFKVLTVLIVMSAVITGILVPNVEFVLAISGATMGTLICYIFPAMFFLRVMTGSSEGKNLAQFVFVCGFTIMLLCTYTTLNSQDKGHVIQPPAEILNPTPTLPILKRQAPSLPTLGKKTPLADPIKESRIEPPNPRAPIENKSEDEKILDRQKLNISMKDKKEEKVVNTLTKIKDRQKLGEKGKQIEDIKQSAEIVNKINKTEDVKKKESVKLDTKKEEEENKLLNELKKQHEEQQRLIDEQKKILAELKEHKEVDHKANIEKQQSVQKQAPADGRQQVQEEQQQQLPKEQVPIDNQQQVLVNRNQHLPQLQVPVNNQQQLPQQQVPEEGQQQVGGEQNVEKQEVEKQINLPVRESSNKGQHQKVVEQNMDDNLRFKRDIPNINYLKGVKENTKENAKTDNTKKGAQKLKDINKDVNDEMKRRLLSENNPQDNIEKSR